MGPERLQYLIIVAPNFPSYNNNCPSTRFYVGKKNPVLAYQVKPFGSWNNLKNRGLKLCCSASFNEFSNEEMEDLAEKKQSTNDKGNSLIKVFSMSFLPSKLEFLVPSLLGIQPNPPDRNEMERIRIQRKGNRLQIPLSLRMIMRKRNWQRSNFSFCSAKKAFSYTLFMVRELQSYALQITESLCREDLHRVMSKVHVEKNSSFFWLFQQVFSRTPTLMVNVMILLANFIVHSMVGHTPIANKASPLPTIYQETIPDETISTNQPKPDVLRRGIVQDFSYKMEGEVIIWKSVVEEASRMSRFEVLDPETMKQFVSSMKVELKPDDYEEYHRTDLVYQMAVAEDPYNSLLLSNYAQFLYLVSRDYDRAEECLKRAMMVEPHEAELLSRYADFLWKVRMDLWGAEERYQQALAEEPNNHYHASKYASFLWSSGGEETRFPFDNPSNDNYKKVM